MNIKLLASLVILIACSGSARAVPGRITPNAGAISGHVAPNAGAVAASNTAPTMTDSAALTAVSAAPTPVAASAVDSLNEVAQPAAPNADLQQDGVRKFDGVAASVEPVAALPFSDPTPGQAAKIKQALQTALSSRLASNIKEELTARSINTLYRVDNDPGNWYLHTAVRTQGDDPENQFQKVPLVVFNHNALSQLSPELLAAKLAGMWIRHLYRDTIPVSAEKTYAEGSVMVRVFQALTGSTAQNWNGDKDYYIGGTFEIYRHFYFWNQGFQYPNVRQGPYFKNKIIAGEGKPSIDADARGRKTLYQRSRDGEISDDAATSAQNTFDGFVSNER